MKYFGQIFSDDVFICEGYQLGIESIDVGKHLRKREGLILFEKQFFEGFFDDGAPKDQIIFESAIDINQFMNKLSGFNPLICQNRFSLTSCEEFDHEIFLSVHVVALAEEVLGELWGHKG